jgi:beta-lactamase class A
MTVLRPLFCAIALFLDSRASIAEEAKVKQIEAKQIAEIETKVAARLGVVALEPASGKRLEYRASERFPICSTFKLLLACAILHRVEKNEEKLDRRIVYTESDLLDYAPVTKAHLPQGGMTVSELCEAAVEYSDNTAANLLLRTIGGPARLTEYVRTIGDTVTRLDRDEPSLNTAIKGDDRDTTSPLSMATNLQALLLGKALSVDSQRQLLTWLKANTTGAKRLRAGFPADWKIGDKTGSGENGTSNDVAIVWPPDQPPILVAVYLTECVRPASDRDAAIAEVARQVAKLFVGGR